MLKKYPKNLILNITKSEILLSGQKIIEARDNIEQVLNISPGNYPASIVKAKILSSKKEFIQAEEILRDLLIAKIVIQVYGWNYLKYKELEKILLDTILVAVNITH